MADLKAFADYISAKNELLEKEAQIIALLKEEAMQTQLNEFADFCRFNSTEEWEFSHNNKTLSYKGIVLLIKDTTSWLYPVSSSLKEVSRIQYSLVKANQTIKLLNQLILLAC